MEKEYLSVKKSATYIYYKSIPFIKIGEQITSKKTGSSNESNQRQKETENE
jgi:hypothetical protein